MLFQHYTNDFEAWGSYNHYRPPGFEDVHSIGVVNLAHLTGETSLLPTALLACCLLEGALVGGFEHEDGTREQLTLDDVSQCFVAKTWLYHKSRPSASTRWSVSAASGCSWKGLRRT